MYDSYAVLMALGMGDLSRVECSVAKQPSPPGHEALAQICFVGVVGVRGALALRGTVLGYCCNLYRVIINAYCNTETLIHSNNKIELQLL